MLLVVNECLTLRDTIPMPSSCMRKNKNISHGCTVKGRGELQAVAVQLQMHVLLADDVEANWMTMRK